jgi:hypothetical protein
MACTESALQCSDSLGLPPATLLLFPLCPLHTLHTRTLCSEDVVTKPCFCPCGGGGRGGRGGGRGRGKQWREEGVCNRPVIPCVPNVFLTREEGVCNRPVVEEEDACKSPVIYPPPCSTFSKISNPVCLLSKP